jgi:heptosyltransferase-2
MAIPAAHALHLEGWEIDWVCGSAVLPVLQLYPWIRAIEANDRALVRGGTVAKLGALFKLWRLLAGSSYDLCATLYYDPRYRLMTLPVRAKRRISLSLTERDRRLLPGRHHTDEFARILSGRADGEVPRAFSPVRAEGLPQSPLPRRQERARVVLAPGGAKNMLADDTLRRWPLESYVTLAASLLAAGVDVVLIGGPDDAWVQPAFAGSTATDLIGRLALVQTVALLDEADVLVTHDTGPLHLGGITRVGIVSIFGPTDPHGRLPQRPGTLAVWGGEGFACRPCYDGQTYAPCRNNGCMQQVSPAMVEAEVRAMLALRNAPPRVATPVSSVG